MAGLLREREIEREKERNSQREILGLYPWHREVPRLWVESEL